MLYIYKETSNSIFSTCTVINISTWRAEDIFKYFTWKEKENLTVNIKLNFLKLH